MPMPKSTTVMDTARCVPLSSIVDTFKRIESLEFENLIAFVRKFNRIYWIRILSSMRETSPQLDLNMILMSLREACPCKISAVSLTTLRSFSSCSCGDNTPFSMRLLSSSSLTWLRTSLEVLTIRSALFLTYSFFDCLATSVAKVTMHLRGVISSWLTLDASKLSRKFFCSAFLRFF